MDMELVSLKQVIFTRGNGRVGIKREKEDSFNLMEIFTKVSLSMENFMERVPL